MKNRKIMVTKPFLPKRRLYNKLVKKIWKNEWLTNNGPVIKQFETELKNYLKIENICLTVNGHSALDIAIKALELKGEVITTPFTFASTVHSLVLNNIKPVFCDIKPTDMTIDESKIEDLITDKTTAILPVNVYGHSCNMKEIERIAKKHHLKVLYDGAHAFGVTENNKSTAIYGDAYIYSFHATKLFNTIEGGCVVYKDKEVGKRLSAFRNFGITSQEDVPYVGGNAKMNEFQAAMGICNLKSIDKIIKNRKKTTFYYREKLNDVKGISYFVPENENEYTYNYAYLPILVNEKVFGVSRDELHEKLQNYGIYTRKYFYPIIPDFECYKNTFKNAKLPVARKIGQEVLCLPLYYGLKKKNIDYIIESIKRIGGI